MKNQSILSAVSACLIISGITTFTPVQAIDKTSFLKPPPAGEMQEEKIDGKTYQVCRFIINSPPQNIWRVLTDYENAVHVFPCLKRCRVVKDSGSTKQIEHHIRPSGIPTNFEYLLEVREIEGRLQQWRRLKGDFSDMLGFWKLEPLDDGARTRVTYASYVNGGLFIPQGLIKRQTKIDMPLIMGALKSNAETGREIASRK